jgi:site-specific DNA-methyltransferase (adenine-specific)
MVKSIGGKAAGQMIRAEFPSRSGRGPLAQCRQMNRLLFGDNLKWLRDAKLFPDASVDLVYLDPPFNSNADYNVLFREAAGEASQAQFHAFTDTWNWADAAETYAEFVDDCPNTAVVDMMDALHDLLRNSPMMAYLAMMAPRLVELHRVLKPTGSMYLHCDPTASHYLRILLDGILGAENFRNEIIWKRTSAHSGSRRWGPIHDVILFYSKTRTFAWNQIFQDYSEEYLESFYRYSDEKGRFRVGDLTGAGTRSGESGQPWRRINPTETGRHWAVPNKILMNLVGKESVAWTVQKKLDALDKEGLIYWPAKGRVPAFKRYLEGQAGVPIGDVISDINPIGAQAQERLGYPTQKPLPLLERILRASSNKSDIVLDPFCGCGTTIHAAQKLGRQWIGIDVTYLAINLIKRRLKDAFGDDVQFEERGQPTDFGSAKELAGLDKWQFQQWALSLIDARPRTEGDGKGADRGVDGLLYFYESKDKRERILVQVKGGAVKRNDVATLLGDVNNQKFAAGILLTLEKPTKPMREEAADAGRYASKLWHDKDYPKIQLLTIEGLLAGTERVEAPPQLNPFAKARREPKPEKQQEML